MIRPVIRGVIRSTVKAAGDVFGPELTNNTTAIYTNIDINNFSEFDETKQKYHIVSDGTSVTIRFPNTLSIGDNYEMVASNLEGFGNPANNTPSLILEDKAPIRYEAQFIDMLIKRYAACDVYFDLSTRKVTQGKGVVR